MSGYSGAPLAQKLGIKPGMLVGVLNGPGEFRSLLEPIPAGAKLHGQPVETCDVLIVFGADTEAVRAVFEKALRLLPAEGGLWVAWPKKRSGVQSGLDFRVVQNLGLGYGLVDNKICAIDDHWSGLRFVVRKEDRSEWAQSNRKP